MMAVVTSSAPPPQERSAARPVLPAPPAKHWWQHAEVRGAVTAVVFVGLVLGVPQLSVTDPRRLQMASSLYLELTPAGAQLLLGLLLMPFLRLVSYRKRDALIIGLLPLYGEFLAAKVLYRLMALPRRDWPPRPDERPRAVPVPGSRGVYVQPATFAAAEELRSRWCVNPEHQHPYASWAEARWSGCTRRGPAAS